MHAVIAFSALPLFLGALLSDWAYSSNYQDQWANFATWLIAGGLLLTGLALLWAVVDLVRLRPMRQRRGVIYVLALFATFLLGFINALVHARDGWATMPMGLVLSTVVTALALAGSVFGLAAWRGRWA
jgi:uncharacterized membrane protein